MNRLLLDTHAIIWWLHDPDRISGDTFGLIEDGANEVAVSVASIWEISIKQSLGKLRVDGDLRQQIAEQDFVELPVLGEHAVAVAELPWHHKDPFDRLLVAQAKVDGYALVSADRQLAAYDVQILPV